MTQKDRLSARLEKRVQACREWDREIRPTESPRGEGEGRKVPKQPNPCCREKPLPRARVPVPQTDTGRRGENPQARERTLVKELGKMTL